MKKLKRLLITTDCFLPRWDGISRFLAELIPFLKKSFKITILAPRFEGKPPYRPGVRVVRFPLVNIRFGDIWFSKPDSEIVRKAIKEADVVFNQTIGPIGLAAIREARKMKKPIVSYVHSIEWELAYQAVKRFKGVAKWVVRLIARQAYRKCSLLLVPSKEVEDLLTGNKITTPKEVVQLGVDTKHFTPPKNKALAKKAISINPKFRIIGFCGRIGREKDLPTLYNAFAKVRAKHKSIKLLVIGKGLEEELPKIRGVIRPGAVDNVLPYLQAMDIFVMPSLTETSSLATMEAMATGLAVVATPVGLIPKYVDDGKNGLIFPRGDVECLAKKLSLLLSKAKLRKKLGAEARKTILTSYKWTGTAERVRKILLSTAKSHFRLG